MLNFVNQSNLSGRSPKQFKNSHFAIAYPSTKVIPPPPPSSHFSTTAVSSSIGFPQSDRVEDRFARCALGKSVDQSAQNLGSGSAPIPQDQVQAAARQGSTEHRMQSGVQEKVLATQGSCHWERRQFF